MSLPPADRAVGLPLLIGADSPEVGCDQCFDLLDVYVDAELAGHAAEQTVPGMRAHLVGCPACAEEYRSLLDLARTPPTE